MQPRLVSLRAAPALLAGLALLAGVARAAPPDAGNADRKVHRVIALDAARSVRIDLRYGDLRVEPGSAGRVEAALLIRCEHGSRRCSEHLDEIELETQPTRDGLELRVVGLPRFSNHGTHLELQVQVPPGVALDADVGAGHVEIRDVEEDLRVELGAGEIEVRMPASAVRSVDARAGVGEAKLSYDGTTLSPRRNLVGGHVEWEAGRGSAGLDLRVGAGEVDVRLE